MVARARDFPHAMLATATHDHKRGEDVRARLAVLSEIPDAWRDRVSRWDTLAADLALQVDPADRYMLFQTLFGAWPPGLNAIDRSGLTAFADRIIAWQQKALREAKLRSSWEAPDEAYEAACEKLVLHLLDPSGAAGFLADLKAFIAQTAFATRANMLVQAALRCTVPGMPDLYQGCELADFSLVDPDNRQPVDFGLRQAAREDPERAAPGLQGGGKLALIVKPAGAAQGQSGAVCRRRLRAGGGAWRPRRQCPRVSPYPRSRQPALCADAALHQTFDWRRPAGPAV